MQVSTFQIIPCKTQHIISRLRKIILIFICFLIRYTHQSELTFSPAEACISFLEQTLQDAPGLWPHAKADVSMCSRCMGQAHSQTKTGSLRCTNSKCLTECSEPSQMKFPASESFTCAGTPPLFHHSYLWHDEKFITFRCSSKQFICFRELKSFFIWQCS